MSLRSAAAVIVFAVVFWAYVILSLAAEDYDVILIRGTLEAAAHEIADGHANVRSLTLSVPKQSDMHMHLTDKLGQTVEIRMRVIQPRELKAVKR